MPTDFGDIVQIFIDLLAAVLPVIIGLAFLAFIWGLAKFVFRLGDEKALEEGRSLMIWGVLAMFILISVWGILRFAYGEFGFTNPFGIPLLPGGI